jgi:hypothetical protein
VAAWDNAVGGILCQGRVSVPKITIDGATVLLTQDNLAWDLESPKTLGGTSTSIHIYVAHAQFLAAGACEFFPVATCYGATGWA